jgi:WD40 repeat protein
MISEEEEPEEKPIVEYQYLPPNYLSDSEKEEEDKVQKIINEYNSKNKITKIFGENIPELNDEIKNKIYNFYLNKYTSNIKDKINSEDNLIIPMTHVVRFYHTKKTSINSLDIDNKNNRLVTGSSDGTVKIWDFNSLTRRPKPNHSVDCSEEKDFPVVSVSWAPSGGFFLVCTESSQAKVISREGVEEISCLKGDNYLVDIRNTKGHTYGLRDGKWHPLEKNIFLTSSADATIRLWDIYGKQFGIDSDIAHKNIFKVKTLKNKKIPVNCCNFNRDGKIIIGGVNDGSIQLFTTKSYLPQIYIPNAHENNCEISSIVFMENNRNFYSRATDNTMKLWDLRNYTKPIKIFNNLPSNSYKTEICLSPDEDYVLTGTSVIKSKNKKDNNDIEYGKVKIFSTTNHELINSYDISPNNSVISLKWRKKINQILVGTTDGYVNIYFSPPNISNGGIINSIFKRPKEYKEKQDIYNAPVPIITPMQLPLFEEKEFSRQTYLEKIGAIQEQEEDNMIGAKNFKPYSVCKAAKHNTLTQHIFKSLNKAIYAEGDPQEQLNKFGGNKGEGIWIEKAYKKTQPKEILDKNPNIEDEVKFYESTKKHKCPNCGLKFCTCKKNIFQLPISELVFKRKVF